MMHECDWACERNKRGYCAHKRRNCKGNGNVFENLADADKIKIIEHKDICKNSSIFGNYYIEVDAKDVAALIAGKCLALTDEEYNIFISYRGE